MSSKTSSSCQCGALSCSSCLASRLTTFCASVTNSSEASRSPRRSRASAAANSSAASPSQSPTSRKQSLTATNYI